MLLFIPSLANFILLETLVSSLEGLCSQFEAEALGSSSVVNALTQCALNFVFCVLCKGSRGASCQSVSEGLGSAVERKVWEGYRINF